MYCTVVNSYIPIERRLSSKSQIKYTKQKKKYEITEILNLEFPNIHALESQLVF